MMADAVERGDRTGVGDLLHPDYSDDRHPDKRAALASVFWYSRQHRNIHRFKLVRDIEVGPDATRATTVVMVAMAGVPIESIEALISLQVDLYRFDVDWRLDDGDWKVLSSRWQRADLSSYSSG